MLRVIKMSEGKQQGKPHRVDLNDWFNHVNTSAGGDEVKQEPPPSPTCSRCEECGHESDSDEDVYVIKDNKWVLLPRQKRENITYTGMAFPDQPWQQSLSDMLMISNLNAANHNVKR